MDLHASATMFEASSWLQSASTALLELVRGNRPDSSAQSAMQWAGSFLLTMDWEHGRHAATASDSLAMQATAARPTFYATLMKIGPLFKDLGFGSRNELMQFYRSLYEVLSEGGESAEDLDARQLRAGAVLLHELSAGLLLLISQDHSSASSTRL